MRTVPNEFLDTFLAVLMIFATLIIIVLLIAYYINRQIMKLPENTPEKYNRRKQTNEGNKSVVVCVGDSITHGRISSNYVRILRKKLGSDYEFINAGVNSNLAWNVLERLQEIIDCNPDFITVLIGTNDANAVLSPDNMKDYIKRMQLPRDPDLAWFKESLERIISKLKQKTRAHIALFTLPTIGESPASDYFNYTLKYSEIIQEIAQKYEVECLPLQTIMIEYLFENPGAPRFSYEQGMKLMIWSAIQRYFFLRSWDTISKKAGFNLHLDYLHLNTQGASMIADLIIRFLESRMLFKN
ncbi:MAG: SGNH/GDSL hydrolase family protein [Candidatus Hodarchaeales archaeon]